MSFERQNPILERFALHPPNLRGGVDVAVTLEGGRYAQLLLHHGGHRFVARAAALTVPYPSGLARLVSGDPTIGVVLVERAPPGLVEAIERRGLSYLDLDGYGSVVGPGFVYVAPRPVELSEGRQETGRGSATTSPFAPKASRVVRALLAQAGRAWRLSELAEQVQMNPGNVHRILNALAEGGLVIRDLDQYAALDPGSLLEAWCDLGPRRPLATVTVPVQHDLHADVAELLARLGPGTVVSGELAAELYAPHLPASAAVVHCTDPERQDLRDVVRDFGGPRLRRMPEEIVIDVVDEGVADFSDSVGGMPLSSPAQVYFDLYRDPGRGRDAAEELRRRVLGF